LAWMKVHQNFFKHGSKDPHDSIKFNPESNMGEIRIAIEVYLLIKREAFTPLMGAFCLRCSLLMPEVHSPDLYAGISPQLRASLKALPNKQFLLQAMRLKKAL
jgi:hypothetical protein